MRILCLSLVAMSWLGAARAEAQTPAPQEFLDEAKQLLVVGACADGPETKVKAAVLEPHCKKVKAAQEDYKKQWLALATDFFKANVPAGLPKTVVYPFAGGDLSTALTVFPDADEITTLSLEPAGDPKALSRLTEKELVAPLATVATELNSLYRYNYSKTMDMIGSMSGGRLPTQLIFSLSALWIHGYEPTSMRYFTITKEGDVQYMTADDVKKLDAIKDTGNRNRQFASVEIKFRKKGGREQVFRHILANIDDAHLKATPGPLLHLQKKGRVSAMTKAASYLLTFDNFITMRKYLADNVEWMVSDSTGLLPKYGTPAGFEYEVHGAWESSNMPEGNRIAPAWKTLYAAQPKRPLKFRFGYPSGGPAYSPHLIIMRKAKTPAKPELTKPELTKTPPKK